VAACRRRYGKVFSLRISSLGTLVYLDDPADIKTVFAGDPSVYHAGEANSMLAGLLGSTSVLVVDGDVHRDRRRLLLAPFHRDAVARQTGVIAEIAADNVKSWPIESDFAVAPKMSEITLEVILRTVIGATDPARLAELRDIMPKLLNLGGWESSAVATPGLQRLGPWRTVRSRIEEADRLLRAEIAARRTDPDLATRTDALAMLIRAADGDEYLDAVARETLRIRPVVFDVGRILKEPTDLAGYRLPAGVMVAPGIGLVHTSAQQYPEPHRFNPDRMLGATPSPTTWLPFGGGNRRCLGATFALVEMKVVLREVLRRADLATTTAAAERQRVKHVILVPHRGGRIRVRAIHDVAPTPPTCPVAHRV
jgi:cytochrome P450